jgi:hypothetical protein
MSVDDIGRDRACAAPKVISENSQAKGPVSDETLESHALCGAEEAIRPGGESFRQKNRGAPANGCVPVFYWAKDEEE